MVDLFHCFYFNNVVSSVKGQCMVQLEHIKWARQVNQVWVKSSRQSKQYLYTLRQEEPGTFQGVKANENKQLPSQWVWVCV